MPPSTLYTGQRDIRSTTMERIQLPKVIPCQVCKKNKPQEQFSKKQLGDLKSKVSRFGRATITPANSIRCFQCTGTQNTEMRCILCCETKILKKFALAQRRNPDTAKCLDCMQAQELVLPHDTEEFGVDDEDNEEVDDVDTGSRHPDPWDKDPHSGQYLVDQYKQPGIHRYTTPASGSSRILSGYDTSSNSISGYSKVDWKETGKGNAYANSPASNATSTATGGVKLNTPAAKVPNAGKGLTADKLAALNVTHPVNMFDNLRIEDAYGGSDEGSDDDFDRRTTTTATGEAPRKPPSVAVSGAYQQDHYNSDDDNDDEGERRPQRLPVTRAGNKYTAYDPQGNPHEIADTASTVPSNYAPSSTDAASTSHWSTVGKSKKISHSGFDHRKDNIKLPNNPRKFARVRPQNLDAERVNENLLNRAVEEKKAAQFSLHTYKAYLEDDDEDY